MNATPFYTVFLILFSGMVSITSCKNHHHDAQVADPLYQEVMAIHDDVMPKMSTVHHYKKELKKKRDQHPEWKDSIQHVIHSLDLADESMMSWMEKFSLPKEPKEMHEYLLGEKVKISQVSDDMYQAMEKAKTLLDSLKHD